MLKIKDPKGETLKNSKVVEIDKEELSFEVLQDWERLLEEDRPFFHSDFFYYIPYKENQRRVLLDFLEFYVGERLVGGEVLDAPQVPVKEIDLRYTVEEMMTEVEMVEQRMQKAFNERERRDVYNKLRAMVRTRILDGEVKVPKDFDIDSWEKFHKWENKYGQEE